MLAVRPLLFTFLCKRSSGSFMPNLFHSYLRRTMFVSQFMGWSTSRSSTSLSYCKLCSIINFSLKLKTLIKIELVTLTTIHNRVVFTIFTDDIFRKCSAFHGRGCTFSSIPSIRHIRSRTYYFILYGPSYSVKGLLLLVLL